MAKKPAKSKHFLSEGFNLPKIEEKVLKFWKDNRIFEKSLENRKSKKTSVFYEGPPTANGRPGIHHVLARAFKDIIPRFKTMQGYFVPRKGGWDTHGLPVEIEVEKKLGLKSKKDIEKYGIAEFNAKCKESVWQYKDEWERLTERMGFWLDLKNPYITYEPDYIESLWEIIAQFWKKGLMYEGHKVVPWCTRCGTALSSHELAQGYEEDTDNAVYVKFKLRPKQKIGNFITDDKTYILSWTTTPWTLPGNVALAVGRDINYGVTVRDGEKLITAEDSVLGKELGHEGEKLKGNDLVGLKYEPLFNIKALQNSKSHKIYAADFVKTDEGTGVVHTAVMYGEDDYELGTKLDLPKHHTVDEQGKFAKNVPGFTGKYVKAPETEKKILDYLQKNGNLFKIEKYTHEYPHCWRCGTPLLYYARNSWFVAVSKLRKKLLENNESINWIPEHLKHGRFGEWLKDAKDWNFSRERYWGTPLPIWRCKECGETHVMQNFEALSRAAGQTKNEYFVMRHGLSENITLKICDYKNKTHLTPKGEKQAESSALKFKKEHKGKVDLIISSPLPRTKETAVIVASILGVKKIIFEPRLAEISTGVFQGKPLREYRKLLPSYKDRFEEAPKGGETLRAVRRRVWEALSDLEKKYRGKRILIVSHSDPIWMLFSAAQGWSEARAQEREETKGGDFIQPAEIMPLEIKNLPRNESGELDPHRPYVDKLKIKCKKCGGEAERIKELVDVWFDSGSMPFAQVHYPEENKDLIDKRKLFPADYITEAVDQTRGWFYTLLAVSTLLGNGAPYKNVISLGHINDKFGKKMSKSKGNVVDPWEMADKHGMDAVRWYFYAATPPGEPRNFDEEDIKKFFRRFHLMLYNSLVFYTTYGATVKIAKPDSKYVLDQWLLARLAETEHVITSHLQAYDIRAAALTLEGLVDDVSRWYIRRSRRRFQPERAGESGAEHKVASAVLGYVLSETMKLAAPFTPFMAEALYHELAPNEESVHLADWPKAEKLSAENKKLLSAMAEVRRIASAALAKRMEAGVKLRQPLSELKIKNYDLNEQLLDILKDEVNVKEITMDAEMGENVALNTELTAELKAEGTVRELIRMVQGLRQEAKCLPHNKIAVYMELAPDVLAVAQKFEKELAREVGAEEIEFKRTQKFDAELTAKFDERDIWIGVKKIK